MSLGGGGSPPNIMEGELLPVPFPLLLPYAHVQYTRNASLMISLYLIRLVVSAFVQIGIVFPLVPPPVSLHAVCGTSIAFELAKSLHPPLNLVRIRKACQDCFSPSP